MNVILVEKRTDYPDDSITECLHVASTKDRALDWIKEHGQDWEDFDGEKYYFSMYSEQVDSPEDVSDKNDLCFADKNGQLFPDPLMLMNKRP